MTTLEFIASGKPFVRLRGWDTPPEERQVYVPAAVWEYGPEGEKGAGAPTVSVEEALALGAIPGTIDLEKKAACWPSYFWE
jgi:hypothetical protein